MTVKAYLAGPIQHADERGTGWRNDIEKEYTDIEWINPLDYNEPSAEEYKAGDFDVAHLVEKDKELIDKSDAVFVGWSETPSCGTPMEVLYAWERDIPVYVWWRDSDESDGQISPWMVYHATAVALSRYATVRMMKDETLAVA